MAKKFREIRKALRSDGDGDDPCAGAALPGLMRPGLADPHPAVTTQRLLISRNFLAIRRSYLPTHAESPTLPATPWRCRPGGG